MASFTTLLGVLAIYQSSVINGQLKAMRSDTQAWVTVDFRDKPSFADWTINGLLTTMLSMKNGGKTPAANLSGDLGLEIMPLGQDPDFNAPVIRNQIFEGTLLAGDHKDIPVARLRQKVGAAKGVGEAYPFTQNDKDALDQDKAWMAVFGRITYEDVFHKPHWTQFCFWLNLRSREREYLPMYMTKGCAKYNAFDRD